MDLAKTEELPNILSSKRMQALTWAGRSLNFKENMSEPSSSSKKALTLNMGGGSNPAHHLRHRNVRNAVGFGKRGNHSH